MLLLFVQIHSEEFIIKCHVGGDGGYMFDCMLVLELRAFGGGYDIQNVISQLFPEGGWGQGLHLMTYCA